MIPGASGVAYPPPPLWLEHCVPSHFGFQNFPESSRGVFLLPVNRVHSPAKREGWAELNGTLAHTGSVAGDQPMNESLILLRQH